MVETTNAVFKLCDIKCLCTCDYVLFVPDNNMASLPDSEEVIKNLLKLDITKIKPLKKKKIKCLVTEPLKVHKKSKHFSEVVKVKRRPKPQKKKRSKTFQISIIARRR